MTGKCENPMHGDCGGNCPPPAITDQLAYAESLCNSCLTNYGNTAAPAQLVAEALKIVIAEIRNQRTDNGAAVG